MLLSCPPLVGNAQDHVQRGALHLVQTEDRWVCTVAASVSLEQIAPLDATHLRYIQSDSPLVSLNYVIAFSQYGEFWLVPQWRTSGASTSRSAAWGRTPSSASHWSQSSSTFTARPWSLTTAATSSVSLHRVIKRGPELCSCYRVTLRLERFIMWKVFFA